MVGFKGVESDVYRRRLKSIPALKELHKYNEYSRSGNIHEVLFFANFARTNSLFQETREKYYYYSVIDEKGKFTNSKLHEKSKNQKFAKILPRENYQIYSSQIKEKELAEPFMIISN